MIDGGRVDMDKKLRRLRWKARILSIAAGLGLLLSYGLLTYYLGIAKYELKQCQEQLQADGED